MNAEEIINKTLGTNRTSALKEGGLYFILTIPYEEERWYKIDSVSQGEKLAAELLANKTYDRPYAIVRLEKVL